ncbi:MAG: DnaJ C-terminal domain-containing protein [Actinomycetaceae bacterium]|nr:DnaJ C-terminal domain-containing protein [Actinomycetaceae bacterium]
MAGQDWMEKDFYKVLGVKKDADADTIKKAYRKLARENHPDQHPGDKAAEERFKNVGEAYKVLSDPKQRKQYDAIRAMAGGGARFSAGPSGGASGFEDLFGSMFGGGSGGPHVRFSTSNAGGGTGGFDDILSGLFGGGGATFDAGSFAGPGGFSQARRGSDLATKTTLSLRQAVEGTTVKMTVEGRSMTVRIPAGVSGGQKIRLRGKGRPGVGGAPAGDLVVTIAVDKHPVYRIEGKNLHMRLPISYPEAVQGAKVNVPLLDGSSVTVKVPAGTSSGANLRVRKRGLVKGRTKGDLIIEIEIATPDNLTREGREAVKNLAQALGDWDPRSQLAEQVRQ